MEWKTFSCDHEQARASSGGQPRKERSTRHPSHRKSAIAKGTLFTGYQPRHEAPSSQDIGRCTRDPTHSKSATAKGTLFTGYRPLHKAPFSHDIGRCTGAPFLQDIRSERKHSSHKISTATEVTLLPRYRLPFEPAQRHIGSNRFMEALTLRSIYIRGRSLSHPADNGKIQN